MQKVFKNCYEMDRRCYDEYGLNEDILMEHAAEGMAEYIRKNFSPESSVMIVSGPGNNGADGVVLARLLHRSYDVKLFLPFGAKSPMAELQLHRAEKIGIDIVDGIEGADIVVDAFFGAGLNRELNEQSIKIIEEMNELEAFKIACDIPSGTGEDGRLMPMAFLADVTITMGALKEALYLDESKDCTGEIICVDLGVDRTLYEMESDTFVLERSDMKLPFRKKRATHKGTFGHVAILCGEKEGAAVIAGSAALRFGAGLTTLVIHEQVSPPAWLMTSTVVPENTTALAVGMGLGSYFEKEFLRKYVMESSAPLVLDADSFYSKYLLSTLDQKGRKIILTPHPKEFVSLWKIVVGEKINVSDLQESRFDFVRKFSERFPDVVLLLKGANMLIAHHKKIWINPFGSAKLSKGGSGDVLSGLIAALLAQGYGGADAAISASLALSEAADRYDGADYGMLPTDLIDEIGRLWELTC